MKHNRLLFLFSVSTVLSVVLRTLQLYYSVDAATNTLTVPVGTGTAISVPAMTGGVPGVTVVSVTGTIVA